MRKALPFVLIAFAGCVGTAGEGDWSGSGGQDASVGSGGATQTGSGGSGTGSGGSGTGSGGIDSTGSGGGTAMGSGGSGGFGSGGRVGSGGVTSSGGRAASGGIVGSGGVPTGGVIGSGGRVAIGSGGVAGGVGSGGRGPLGGRMGAGGVLGSGGAGGIVAGSGGSSATVCSSGKTWTSGNGQDMRPGNDCKGCHSFTIAGTVYPTAHEPNNCDGTASGGIKVVITGADGSTVTLTPSAASGNFYSNSTIKTPFTAKVTNTAGAVRMMVASQTAGNCNSCHTQDGGNGAPGRIMAP